MQAKPKGYSETTEAPGYRGRALTQKDQEDCSKASGFQLSPSDRSRSDDRRRAATAQALLNVRLAREDSLGQHLFFDASWDMLLDLFVAAVEHRRLCVTAVCIGSRASAATALRYLHLLEECGLALREPDPYDGRRHHVLLTPLAYDKMSRLMDACLSAVCAADTERFRAGTSGEQSYPAFGSAARK